jgi:hypothetical protein
MYGYQAGTGCPVCMPNRNNYILLVSDACSPASGAWCPLPPPPTHTQGDRSPVSEVRRAMRGVVLNGKDRQVAMHLPTT